MVFARPDDESSSRNVKNKPARAYFLAFKKTKVSFGFFSIPTLVECRRFKLLTSAMRMQRSISWANTPCSYYIIFLIKLENYGVFCSIVSLYHVYAKKSSFRFLERGRKWRGFWLLRAEWSILYRIWLSFLLSWLWRKYRRLFSSNWRALSSLWFLDHG